MGKRSWEFPIGIFCLEGISQDIAYPETPQRLDVHKFIIEQ